MGLAALVTIYGTVVMVISTFFFLEDKGEQQWRRYTGGQEVPSVDELNARMVEGRMRERHFLGSGVDFETRGVTPKDILEAWKYRGRGSEGHLQTDGFLSAARSGEP